MSDRGAFLSVLDYINQFGQVPENLLRGNWGAAGRHLADLALKPIDAVLPGDWIPDIAQKEDYTSPSELLGIDKNEHPWLGGAADLVGDTLLNPTTYIPGALLAKGIGGAVKGAGALARGGITAAAGTEAADAAASAAGAFGRGVRRTFGAERLSPLAADAIQKGNAAKVKETSAGIDAIKASGLKDLMPEDRTIVTDLIQNQKWENGAPVGKLAEDASGMSTDPFSLMNVHPGITDANREPIRQALIDTLDIGQEQGKLPNAFFKKSTPDPLTMGAMYSKKTGFDEPYLMSSYKGQTQDQAINDILDRKPARMGPTSTVREKELTTPDAIGGYLKGEPGITYERDAAKLMAQRAEQQGTIAQRAEIGKSLLGDSFAYADPEMRSLAEDTIKNITASDPESGRALMDAFSGIAPRGKVMQFLATALKPFKQAAVYGIGIPKLGSINRNAISGVWQAFANPESRSTALHALGNLDSTLAGSITDAMGFKYPRDKLKSVIDDIQGAMAGSQGASANAIQALKAAGKDDAASVIEHGVLDGFVRSDDVAKEMSRKPWQENFSKVWNWPAKIFQGVEDRMRVGMFLDLQKTGIAKRLAANMPAEQAAAEAGSEASRITGDSLYRYATNAVENRRARDIIPFFQFQAKAIPQSAKLLAEKPALAVGMSSALHEDQDQPIYPYMQGKLNIPLGKGTDGSQQYLTGFGLPFESLGEIPNPSASAGDFGRELRQSVVGNSNPLLKTAYSLVAGEDPYFQTPYGSYEKMPVFGEAGGIGRAYNEIAQTGIIQPVDSLLKSINSVTDPRETPGVKALDVLTGAKIANVDEDRALQQQLEESLKANPQVRQYRTFYQGGERDQATEDVIQQYHDAKARIKAKRGLSFP